MVSRSIPRVIGNIIVGLLALGFGALLIWHQRIPDTGGVMSIVESFLPWVIAVLLVLAIAALAGRSLLAFACVLAASAVWCIQFLPVILPQHLDEPARITVVSENVNAGNHDPAATIAGLARRHPQLIALQELTASSAAIADSTLDAAYPHHYRVGTVGLWSTLPLSHAEPLTLGLSWKRALRIDVKAPEGTVRLYELHADSVRIGDYATRDTMLANLSRLLRADHSKRLLVVGDFNAASTTRQFLPLLKTVHESPTTGLGFTWPAKFPLARLDHVLERGMTVTSSIVLKANGSDHRGIEVGLR